MESYKSFTILTNVDFQTTKIQRDINFHISQKIRNTHLVNLVIKLDNKIVSLDLFISEEKQGIMLDEQFFDFMNEKIFCLE